MRPSFIERLRTLATNAESLVKTLHETDHVPVNHYELAGLNEAKQILALLDGMSQGDDKSRALAVAFMVQDGLDAMKEHPNAAIQATMFTIGSYLVATGSKPLEEIEPMLLEFIRKGFAAGPMKGPGE